MSHEVTKWTLPSCYTGQSWDNWYSAGFGQNRDSNDLDQSNFATVYEALKLFADRGKDPDDEDGDTVMIVSENHWACGWVEWIAIHESNTEALTMARELCQRANDYPVLDENDLFHREDESAYRLWGSMDLSERVDICRERRESIFAARRKDSIPDRVYDRLRDMIA